MNRLKVLVMLMLLIFLLANQSLMAQDPPLMDAPGDDPASVQPLGYWVNAHPYRWEQVHDEQGVHWLAVWRLWWCYDPHYLPGNWMTCVSGWGCIGDWTWWLHHPESKLGVPSTWRTVTPGAQNLSNYIATGYFAD
jgi:hypothetical protein